MGGANLRYAGLYGASVVALILLYSGNLGDAFKGEMWELLYISTTQLSLGETFREVSTFACFGAGRFQPLAFFVPYLQVILGGTSFVFSHLFSLGLHLLCALLLAALAFRWLRDPLLTFFAFAAFLFSFLASDVLIWTFFTYIQVHALLLLASIGLFAFYLRSERRALLFLSWGAAIVSAMLYESGIAALLAQPAFAILSGRVSERRRFLLEVFFPVLIFAAYVGMAFLAMSLNYRDSSAQIHPMVFAKVLTYLAYFVRYNAGLVSDAHIYDIASIFDFRPGLSVWNMLGVALLVMVVSGAAKVLIRGRNQLRISASPELWLVAVALLGYVLIMGFGRVPKGISFLTPSGLETQFRYYYVSSALIPMLVVLAIGRAGAGNYSKGLVVAALVYMVLGNGYNIVRLGEKISVATTPLTAHALGIIGELSGSPNAEEKLVQRMHRDWYTESIPTPRQFRAYTFNANRCLPHAEYSIAKPALPPALIVTQPGPPEGVANLAVLREIDMTSYAISDSSSHPTASAVHAATGKGVWHAMHIPVPPQTLWMEVDFGGDKPRRVGALGFTPREGHPDQFWDNAVLQGSSNKVQWEDIVDLKFTAPPADKWHTIRFSNDKSYRYYRLTIKGGFSLGRFIALGGIKMYEW
jgi:hypothetical protein